MSELEKFKAAIRSICLNLDPKFGPARYALHDWDLYYRNGYRESNAGEAYREAMRCE